VTYFYFQAEEGIREDLVTGVQTCALPICPIIGQRTRISLMFPDSLRVGTITETEGRASRLALRGRATTMLSMVKSRKKGSGARRSEERRVGKEYRAGREGREEREAGAQRG